VAQLKLVSAGGLRAAVVDAVNNGLWQVGRGAGEVVDKALLCKHSSTTMHAGATLKQCLSVCTHKFSTLLSLISPTQVLDLALVEQDNATSLEGAEWRAMSDQERLAACTPLRVLAKASPHDKALLVQALQASQ
jgi:magnesium-transporting ATPase (P-type)